MTPEDAVSLIKAELGERLLDFQQPSETRVFLEVESDVIPDTARILFRELQARLQTATGLDAPKKMEIIYHWALDPCGLVISVRTHIDRENPEIASITPICPAAEWIEREMWELLGIGFTEHPNLQRLLLTEDWPQGQFPLRRDYRKGE